MDAIGREKNKMLSHSLITSFVSALVPVSTIFLKNRMSANHASYRTKNKRQWTIGNIASRSYLTVRFCPSEPLPCSVIRLSAFCTTRNCKIVVSSLPFSKPSQAFYLMADRATRRFQEMPWIHPSLFLYERREPCSPRLDQGA